MPSERIQRKIDSLLDEAESALTRNDWQAVIERAKAVLALDPNNEDATGYREAAQRGASEESGAAATAGPLKTGAATPTIADRPSNVPSSFASGRYTVKKFLGEGGKKRVFLAHDMTLDRDVAFALIKTEGLDDSSRHRITREAQAMGRLGDHPNIVPIFDLGQEKDPSTGVQQPFMVLPVMTGGDVEGVIEKAPDHKVPLERVLQIAKDTCEGLVFAHSKGIVHRDLKPGNVWLTDRGVARIGDFGLAVATDRSRLTREGMMVGTVAYMPPEQAMGGEITPRADLYSLGAMLYEMVTGRPPFLGDDDIAIIGQHINTPPVAPGWHNPQCPKPLDALIRRLLAKDPKQRPESAGDVLQALEAVDMSAVPSPHAGDAKGDGLQQGRSLDSVSSGVFVGRQKEMDQLRVALEETLSGHGRMVTLVGEPGIGKTRTAQELQTYAGLRRTQVLWGRCYEGGGAPPYWPWVQAIRQYAQEREPDQLRKEMGSTASIIAEVVPEVKERLPGLQAPPQLESPESARFRLFDSIAAFLKGASKSQPIVLVLDDLHWSDKPSLLLLEFVAKELSNSRVLLVGTYRDVELSRQHPLSQTLGDLNRERLFTRILLRGISGEDVGKFIEMASGVKPPPELTRAVHEQTEGNPLFVTEVVRLLVQDGTLDGLRAPDRGSGKRTTWTVRIPEGVREVIGRRLNHLSARCNEVLTTASVIGREFTLAQVKAATDGLTEDVLLGVLDEALAARVVEELPRTVGRYQFTHALIQETLSNELSITRKVRLHARIAESLEALYGGRAEEHAAELATHFAAAEAVLGTGKLVKYSLAAGETSLDAYAYEQAVQFFERARAALGARPSSLTGARVDYGLGRALANSLRGQDALPILERAFDSFMVLGDRAMAIASGITPIPATPRMIPKIAELKRKVLAVAPPGSVEEATALIQLGNVLIRQVGDHEGGQSALLRGLEVSVALGDRKLQGEALSFMARHAVEAMDIESANNYARKALSLAAPVSWASAEANFIAGLAAAFVGDVEEASRRVRESLRIGAETGSRAAASNGTAFLGGLNALQGNWKQASALFTSLEDHVPSHLVFIGRCQVVLETEGAASALSILSERPSLLTDDEASSSFARGMVAYVLARVGELEKDEKRINQAYGIANDHLAKFGGSHHRWDVEGYAALAVVAGHRRDAELAAAALDGLAAGRGLCLVGGSLAVDRLIGRAARTAGRQSLAVTSYESAIALCGKAGYLPELAWSKFDLADMMTSDGLQTGRSRASALMDEALAIARELGMKPLIERVIARKKILKA